MSIGFASNVVATRATEIGGVTVATYHPTPGMGRQRRAWWVAILTATLILTLSACSKTSDNGGDGDEPKGPPADPQSLAFAYPYNGQQDVPRGTQIVANFGTAVTSDPSQFGLQSADGTTQPIAVVQDDNQPDIYRIAPVDADDNPVKLTPLTTYEVTLSGNTLFQFTTRPVADRPAGEQGFKVMRRTPGAVNPVTGMALPFLEFNAIRLILSEAADSATVIKGGTFTFKDAAGNPIDGRLTALGRYITFDPSEDLDSSKTYTLTLTSQVKSQYGNNLVAYSDTLTPLSTGHEATQVLAINDAGTQDNTLNGLETNVAVIDSRLIGVNRQAVIDAPPGGVSTTLAEGNQTLLGNINPAVIRAGQQVQLSHVALKLSGVVNTPIISGPVASTFINDVDVYLMANQLRDGVEPTAVRLRFDMAISTLIQAAAGTPANVIQSLANGLFTQTVMNIQAAGTLTVLDNGDLLIDTIGSFPIKVNRTGLASIDLELSFVLHADAEQQPTPQNDVIAPFATAAYPSSCLYLFGSDAYGATFAGHPVSSSVPEKLCAGALQAIGAAPPFVNDFPVEASPFVLFSEPVNPATVTLGSMTLLKTPKTSPTPVPATLRVEGATVVVDPVTALDPATNYAIAFNQAGIIKDLAGNAATFGRLKNGGQSLLFFRTEALTDTKPAAPLITSIMPGLPCALAGGDFETGGSTAGHCVGDQADTPYDYPVFDYPSNQAVNVYLTSFVTTESLQLADGCLAGGGSAASSGTVAVQHMQGGACVGVVDGQVVAINQSGDKTRAFSFRPTTGFEPGERYWIVITDGVVGVNGLALNTDPLHSINGAITQNTDDDDAPGGPTLVMPFDAIAPSGAFFATQLTSPYTDTNGNGLDDDAEPAQPANSDKLTVAFGGLLGRPVKDFEGVGYLATGLPTIIRDDVTTCAPTQEVVFNGQPVVAAVPDHCVPVTILPGGLTTITNLEVPVKLTEIASLLDPISVNTGPLTLRYPYVDTNDDGTPDAPQTGYIIERCAFDPDGTGAEPATVFEPCFVANLTLTVNAPNPEATLLASMNAPQQPINVQVFGPVQFLQNGGLVIDLYNANAFTIETTADIRLTGDLCGLLDDIPIVGDLVCAVNDLLTIEANAITAPLDQTFQLTTAPSHGGRAFAIP